MGKHQEKVSLELTKDQFLSLLKAVYLGNWMANANRDGSPSNLHKKEYEAIEDFVFSRAKLAGFPQYVDDGDANEGKFFPTGLFESETDVHELHDAYDEETFWNELIDRLGKRDFFGRYTEDELHDMSQEDWFEKLYECKETWVEEVQTHGIERLGITKDNYASSQNQHPSNT